MSSENTPIILLAIGFKIEESKQNGIRVSFHALNSDFAQFPCLVIIWFQQISMSRAHPKRDNIEKRTRWICGCLKGGDGPYLIFVTGTTGGACVKIFSSGVKFS